MTQQNYANHAKFVTPFHFFAVPVLTLNVFWSCFQVWRTHFSAESIVGVIVAAALVVTVFYARLFALAVQDRVIRLEERLRCVRLLPEDLNARFDEFTVGQLVALRFASDAELPELARKVLNEKLRDRKQIKQLIKNWRADYVRA